MNKYYKIISHLSFLIMKFLDYTGLQHFYEQIKTKMAEVFNELLNAKRGEKDGVAALNGDYKLDHSQYDERSFIYVDDIPAVNNLYYDSYYTKFWMKTINGMPIYKLTQDSTGERPTEDMDITIDMSLYRLVESLDDVTSPEFNRIYLVKNASGKATNVYVEYIAVKKYPDNPDNSEFDWEEFGKFKSDVDLTPYVKLADLDTEVGNLNYIKLADIPIATEEIDGLMYTKDKIKLEGVDYGATADEAIPLEEIDKLFAADLTE